MANELDFFSTYMLTAALEQVEPEVSFFRDRYFPTGAGDIFNTDKVLVEFRKGSRKIAPFVAERVPAIPIERQGYSVKEFAPARIAVSRYLTLDDLKKRGFGEALYSNLAPAQRAARLEQEDMAEMDRRITHTEELMCVNTMINNACTMQEYSDAVTKGDKKYIQFYEGNSSEHKYVIANPWNGADANIIGDVAAMCRLLSKRGMSPTDLIIGADVADVFYKNDEIRKMLDKNYAVNFGAINEQIRYPGVSTLGSFNFRGYVLTIYVVAHTYEDNEGNDVLYFPSDAAMVTFQNCGHLMYGRVDQMDYGSIDFRSVAAKRVPKFFCNNEAETRGLRLVTRPLAAPREDCPYIYAPSVIG